MECGVWGAFQANVRLTISNETSPNNDTTEKRNDVSLEQQQEQQQ